MLALALLQLSCTGSGTLDIPSETAGDTSVSEETGEPIDTDSDTEVPVVDDDGDGHAAEVDCDDANAAVHPDATEAFNGIDDDCDGRIDADGTFEGTHSVTANAVFEGTVHSFNLACPATVTRTGTTFDFTITCTTVPTDAMAQVLLGATVTVTPRRHDVTGATWSGSIDITSSNGWDTRGDGSLNWTTMESVQLQTSDSNFSLVWAGSGALAWTGE